MSTDWNEVLVAGQNRFHRLGLPDKLATLEKDFAVGIDQSLSQHVLSANVARNCLVHRNGQVGARDLNAESELRVTWRRMAAYLKDEDGLHELVYGEPTKKEAWMVIKFEDTAKTFSPGEMVNFSPTEFVEICWMLFMYGVAVTETVSKRGLALGFIEEVSNGGKASA